MFVFEIINYNLKLFLNDNIFTVMASVPIYVINFRDNARKERMVDRFQQVGMQPYFVDPVTEEDARLVDNNVPYKRTSSIMLQHLDSIRHFLENTQDQHCIICEDDIYISKYFDKHLPDIIKQFTDMELDLLLLGYLFPYTIHGNWHFPVLKNDDNYSYHNYPDDIWGSQMYLISRAHAHSILEKFTVQYALDNLEVIPYNPDWTITKFGKRALISPMIAVEEGDNKSDHEGQHDFHSMCSQYNYKEDVHI